MFQNRGLVHFVGIGGVGMSGIAELLIKLGFKVTGSDIAESVAVKKLRKLGAGISIGHRASNVGNPDVVVVTSAVTKDNPEILRARAGRIPVIQRAEMLAELMRLKKGIAVAGTHGKTTTTSILGNVLEQAGLDPTTIVGGKFLNIGGHARYGKGEYLVCEADESDGSFLRLSPIISIVTNIDNDHMDYYGTEKNLMSSFTEFINRVPFYGFAVLCGDDRRIRQVIPHVSKTCFTYGFGKHNDYVCTDIRTDDDGMVFRLVSAGKKIGQFRIPRFGRHAVLNASATIIVALKLGLTVKELQKGLVNFKGVGRRMELIGSANGITIYDDYAHHPTELRATIAAFRLIRARRRIGIFQPHRYTRTKILRNDFVKAFKGLDVLIITDIYAASEKPIKGVTGELIAKKVTGVPVVSYVRDKKDIPQKIIPDLREGDMVITFGAGDIYQTGLEMLAQIKRR